MMQKPRTLIVYISTAFLFLLCLREAEACGRGSIYIQDNQYKNILVAISPQVPENSLLIERIKSAFTEASAFLYEATRFRSYFKNITILVPKTWSDKPEYEALGNETMDKSDIVVDLPDPSVGQGDRPFVIKTTPCGEYGYYMHLTPDYLLDDQVAQPYGPYDKVLVHEWAHLRYGVYDEYPSDSENTGHFYAADNGEIEATRCSKSLPGDFHNPATGASSCNYINGFPEPDCRFKDDTDVPTGSRYASLMYKQFLDHIVEFCDDNPSNDRLQHNSESPSLQNTMCDGLSVWTVLNNHPDFKDANPPVEAPSTSPDFKVVKDTKKKKVPTATLR